MFCAREVMNSDVISIRPDTPVHEAMGMLVAHDITGLPVVSEDKRLVGIVSEKDMLDLLYNPHGRHDSVAEIMTPDVVSFDEDAALADVCECLIENHFRRVPITSDGKLAGVISRRDIIKFILKLRQQKTDPS